MPEPAINVPKVDVPVGLATKVGYALGVIQIACAVLIPIIDGIPDDASTASIMVALVLGATTVITRVNDGRQKQAAAIYLDVPSPMRMDDFSGEEDEAYAPGGIPGGVMLVADGGVQLDGPGPEGAVGGKPGPEGTP